MDVTEVKGHKKWAPVSIEFACDLREVSQTMFPGKQCETELSEQEDSWGAHLGSTPAVGEE